MPVGIFKTRHRMSEMRARGVRPLAALRVSTSADAWQRIEDAHVLLLSPTLARQVRTVVDVGANVGLWALAAIDLFNPTRMLCLEPSPTTAHALRRTLADKDVTVSEVAASDFDGTTELTLTADSVNVSLLPPRVDEMNALYGRGYEVVDHVSTEVRTLDTLLQDWDEISLLKIDVQGAERQVLAGATATLRRTGIVQLEVTFQSHYDGDLSFYDLTNLMTAAGFHLANMSPVLVRKGVAMWADAVYVRSDWNSA
jgi:FkbM family methyltransferase